MFSGKYPSRENELKGYQWPASAITVNEMAKLATARELTGKPITKLMREAIAGQTIIPVLKTKILSL